MPRSGSGDGALGHNRTVWTENGQPVLGTVTLVTTGPFGPKTVSRFWGRCPWSQPDRLDRKRSAGSGDGALGHHRTVWTENGQPVLGTVPLVTTGPFGPKTVSRFWGRCPWSQPDRLDRKRSAGSGDGDLGHHRTVWTENGQPVLGTVPLVTTGPFGPKTVSRFWGRCPWSQPDRLDRKRSAGSGDGALVTPPGSGSHVDFWGSVPETRRLGRPKENPQHRGIHPMTGPEIKTPNTVASTL